MTDAPAPAPAGDFPRRLVGRSALVHADCLDWLPRQPENSLHAVVTDAPFALKEFDPEHLDKIETGGGVWRQPPAIGGSRRAPLPRFADLTERDLRRLREFFEAWARALLGPLRPGGHVIVAAQALLAHEVFGAIAAGGLEQRGVVIRLVRTLRGGDRPKGAEAEFPEVSTMPRSCYEPWGVFRKPLPPGMPEARCLEEFGTGALRDLPDGTPSPT